MTITRRDLLKGAGAAVALRVGAPLVFRAGAAWGDAPVDPTTAQRLRLVLVDLAGGNDGLNTVVPFDGALRASYEIARETLRIPVTDLRSLDKSYDTGRNLSLNMRLPTFYDMYQADRLAIVQGIDYPNHSYSHFVSDDIWQSGEPGQAPDSGWLGRHLDRVGIGTGELRGVGLGSQLPLALTGFDQNGIGIGTLPMTFADGTAASANAVHDAYGGFSGHAAAEPLRQFYGSVCQGALDVVTATAPLAVVPTGNALATSMLSARSLLSANLGVEVVVVTVGGYDTHDAQTARHSVLLIQLDQAMEAFFRGTIGGTAVTVGGNPVGPIDPVLESRTLVMTFSEFGRRIGDNGDGTDHGASAPQFFIGPPTTGPNVPAPGSGVPLLIPGLHGDTPPLASPTHAQALKDNLALTVDMRSVYQAVLTYWLNQPLDGANADAGDPLFVMDSSITEANGSLAGLFTRA